MSISVTVAAMFAAGCTPDQISSVVAAIEAHEQKDTRSAAAIRQARYRDRKRNVGITKHNAASQENAAPSPEVPPKDNNQTPLLPPTLEVVPAAEAAKPRADRAEFEEFYQAYPKRENRKDALTRWQSALKKGVTPDRIMAGLARWQAKWTADGTERKFIPAPDVWLNKAKYDDEVDIGGRPPGRIVATNFAQGTRQNGSPKTPSDFLRSVIQKRADNAASRQSELFG